jgi:zinc protease
MKNLRNHSLLAICLLIMWMANLNIVMAAPKVAQKPTKQMNQQQALVDSTKEYNLDNGLKVLIKEDHSAPVFSQAIFYRVGSRNDPKGQTGISHYLEHMQFNGTESRPKGAISEEIERRGGTFNAATSTDFTMYYMTLPSEHLNFSLELEADRMRNSILNKTEADRERQVVLAELSGGENNPMTLLFRDVLKALYPTHPYGRPIIGWRKDVEAITPNNLREFYDTYYQPNNAVLILVGDIDSEKALSKIKKTLGAIPRSNRKTGLAVPLEKSFVGPKTVEVKSPSETSIATFVWNTISFSDKDYVPLSVLSAILTNGPLSRLEKALVDTGKASYVSSSVRQGIDPFTFSVIAATSQSGDLSQIKKVVQSEISRLQKDGVSKEELERVKAKAETSFLFGLEDTSGLASQMGFFELISGDWKRTFYWPKQISEVTPEQVQAVAQKYLQTKAMVVGTLLNDPNAKGPAGPVNANVPFTANYKTNAEAKSSSSTATSSKGIQTEQIILPNGIKLILRQNPNNPVVAISGTVDAGEIFDINFNKAGISAITGLMLDRGTVDYDRDALNIALENIGAEVEISPEKDYVSIGGKSRSQDLDRLIELLAQQIRSPKFPQDELDRLKLQLVSELEQSKDDLSSLGKIAIYQSIYGKQHPYYEPSIAEQIASVKSISVQDLKTFHETFYKPDRLILAISGNFDRQQLLGSLKDKFGDWENTANKAPTYTVPVVQAVGDKKPQQIEVPGKSQASVLLAHAGQISRTSPDFYALLVANDILGGGSTLSSRLGKRVREEAGLVYTIRSSFAMSRGAGPFLVQMGVAPDKIDEAIKLTKEELVKFRNGEITDEELERAKNYRSGFFISNNLTSNENVASSLNQYALWGIDLNTINEYPNKIKAITKADVVRVAQKYIFPDKLQVVVLKPKK